MVSQLLYASQSIGVGGVKVKERVNLDSNFYLLKDTFYVMKRNQRLSMLTM